MSLTEVDSSVKPGNEVSKSKVKDPNSSESSATPHSPEDHYHDLDESNEIAYMSQQRQSVMRIRDLLQRNTGLFLITMAQCCGSSMNVAVKKLNSLDIPVPVMEVIAVRMFLTGLFSLSYMIVAGVNDPFLGPRGIRSLLVLRGSSGFVGLSGLYLSLQYLSLSDATVLTFLAPICLLFTGSIFLGEIFSLRQVFAGLVSLGGVVLIARPTFLFGPDPHIPHLWIYIDSENGPASPDRLISVGMALIGVVGATTAFTTIRGIGKRAHAMHSMLYFSAICVLCSMISMAVTGTPIVVPTAVEWVLLILIGVFGFLLQLFLTMGLQRETVSRGSMAMYTQIIFATIFQRIFFDSYPTMYSALGIILISGSALYVAVSTANSKEEIRKTGDIRLPEDDDIEEGLLGRQSDDAERA